MRASRNCLGSVTYGSPASGPLLPGRQARTVGEAESLPFLRRIRTLDVNSYPGINSELDVNSYPGINPFDVAKVHSCATQAGDILESPAHPQTLVLTIRVNGPFGVGSDTRVRPVHPRQCASTRRSEPFQFGNRRHAAMKEDEKSSWTVRSGSRIIGVFPARTARRCGCPASRNSTLGGKG